MKQCFIVSVPGEENPTVYRNLKKLMDEIDRPRQYQTFRRMLIKEGEVRLGDMTITKADLIFSKQS